jgi:DNA-binding NarL/FixJ family response regulator
LKKPAGNHVQKVCVLSSHTFFLSEIQRCISKRGIRPQARQLNVLPSPSKGPPLSLPRAAVYVLDAERNNQAALAFVCHIRDFRPKSQIVVLADQWTPESALPLLRYGVKGLLTYSEAVAQLPVAVEAVAAGRYWVPRAILSSFVSAMMDKPARDIKPLAPIRSHVSRREQEILEALLENRSNKEIANQFSIAERTVKFHVSNILAKYGVQRRSDLILLRLQQEESQGTRWLQ